MCGMRTPVSSMKVICATYNFHHLITIFSKDAELSVLEWKVEIVYCETVEVSTLPVFNKDVWAVQISMQYEIKMQQSVARSATISCLLSELCGADLLTLKLAKSQP